MPLKRRVSRRRRGEWEWEHRHALVSGHDHFHVWSGYDDVWRMDEARAAWDDVGEDLVAEMIEEHPGTRPVGWWIFVRGMDRTTAVVMKAEEQARYLRRHRLLTPGESSRLKRPAASRRA